MTTQPKWFKPTAYALPKLKIYNSLTKQKEEFIPVHGKRVKWYICGPTVYDKSHLGHARTYIAFDIIRRIMTDYFNYDVQFVMNITDIDDKIIINARQQHLFNEYKKIHSVGSSLGQVKESLDYFLVKRFQKFGFEKDWSTFLEMVKKGIPQAQDEPKFPLYLKTAEDTLDAIKKAEANSILEQEYWEQVQTTLSLWLDNEKGSTVTDASIFRSFSRYWEQDFFKDMDALQIKRPDTLTRVSDYVPEIVSFVEKIIENGYAYELDGSVYFDTTAFNNAPNHVYAKLAPWAANNIKLVEEGEGDLVADPTKKKCSSDFALWKQSKPGEPRWDSPWGPGRPGWHIECSVMAGAILGSNMDIHGGGIDLAFPHHDNELAQSEAYYQNQQWVNYFMHTGHLHIENMKMSKSLKNFLSIRETLDQVSFSQLRLMFLFHSWDSVLDYSQGSLIEAKNFENSIQNFLSMTQALLYEPEPEYHNYNEAEQTLVQQFHEKQDKIHEHLCDSFNTPQVLLECKALVQAGNVYYQEKQKQKALPNASVLKQIAEYITKLLRIFGVFETQPTIGSFGKVETSQEIMPILKTISKFRDEIRRLAQEKKDHVHFLQLCDVLRDEELVEHGIVFEDREGDTLIKLISKQVLLKQKQDKIEKQRQQQEKKLARQKEEMEKLQKKMEKAKINPKEMFQTNEYSAWDEKGIPTLMADGTEVTKSKRKKMEKEYQQQEKLYLEYQ